MFMGMRQFQHWTPRLLRSFGRSRAVIVMEMATTGDEDERRMESCASRPAESVVKALHEKTAVMMLLNLKMT